MNADIINLALGFIEGFALIISPCIIPILPIFLAGSLSGSKKRPVGIITGFTFFFALVAFFSHQFFQYTGVNPNLLRNVSFLILIILGLIMVSTYLTEQFTKFSQRLLSAIPGISSTNNSEGGFFNGFLFGGLIAIIWTPCAGPILAAVIVQVALQKSNLISFLTFVAFSLGAAIPMFLIAFYGKKMMSSMNFFKKHATLIRKLLGAVIITSVFYILAFEGTSFSYANTGTTNTTSLTNGLWKTYKAPELEGIDAWINSPPLTMTELKGKVVLVDFWTYSCINCLRTLPYIKDWYKKYHSQGLEIIGVHTPEFEFEKNVLNVEKAVKSNGILYPVALDNHYKTWTNFDNHYWPAHYLINKEGNVVYTHFGEGDYDVTENNIRFLLGINNAVAGSPPGTETFVPNQTPETYLGYARADTNLGPTLVKDKLSNYEFPSELGENAWGLQGEWLANSDNLLAMKANASLKIHFNARKVFIVMGNKTSRAIKVKLLLNGEQVIARKGKDVMNSNLVVDNYSLYEVVLQKKAESGFLQITTTEPGLELYTFTFGG